MPIEQFGIYPLWIYGFLLLWNYDKMEKWKKNLFFVFQYRNFVYLQRQINR